MRGWRFGLVAALLAMAGWVAGCDGGTASGDDAGDDGWVEDAGEDAGGDDGAVADGSGDESPADAWGDEEPDGGGDDAGTDAGADVDPDVGRCQAGVPLSVDIADSPEMLIVTGAALAPAFEVLAEWKRAKGVPCVLQRVEDIVASTAGEDAAAKVRTAIRAAVGSGVRWVLLGGDDDVVPARLVHSRALFQYDDTFASDFYYSDLDGTWDADGDGTYGELADDLEMHPDVSVARVPASTREEAEAFVNRVLAYEQTDPGCLTRALFISEDTGFLNFDSATQLNPLADDVFPADFQKQKLYWKYESYPGAEPNTFEAQVAALEDGRGFVTHYGHASEYDLNMEMSADQVSALANSPAFPVFVSCGCLAGNFVFSGMDSAGERLLTNPAGGAVAYLGNTNIGLGPAGGTDFIEQFYRAVFSGAELRLGEALDYARENFYSSAGSLDSEALGIRWTQLEVVLFGDPEMPLRTAAPQSLTLEHEPVLATGERCLLVSVRRAGAPLAGATVTLYRPGGFLLRQQSDAGGGTVFRFGVETADELLLTATYPQSLPALGTVAIY